MAVKNWSTTAGSNATVDSINFAEGQAPSSVNDSARALMADVKEWYNEITGGTRSGTVGGTADAITLTTTPTVAAYAVNQRFLLKASGPNTVAAPTLNVSGLGARTIKLPGGIALPTPAWATNDMLALAYDGTDMMLTGMTSHVGPTETVYRNAQTGTTYTVLTGDRGKHITYSNASAVAVTLPQANSTTFGIGWYSYHENIGAGTVTITPTTSTINGAATLTLATGEWALIDSDNTNYRALKYAIPALQKSSAIASKTANYTATVADQGKSIRFASLTADATLTLPPAATAGDGFLLYVSNEDTNDTTGYGVIVDPNGSELIDGFSTRKGYVGTRVILLCDGTGWRTVGGSWLYFSGDQTVSGGGLLTLAHGLGVRPKNTWAELKCITAEGNYSIGDIFANPNQIFDGASPMGFTAIVDATNISVRLSSNTTWRGHNKTTGAAITLTTATNWRLRVFAEA